MKHWNWRSVRVKRRDGSVRSADAVDSGVTTRWCEVDGGAACYVSASCPDGFFADEGILLSPALADETVCTAVENHSAFWCRPAFADRLSALPARVQELFIETDGGCVCCLPICDSVFKTVIRGCEGGLELMLYANDDRVTECRDQLAFLLVEADDPLEAARRAAALAVKLLDNGLALREGKPVADVFEYIGWCSWNALMIRVGEEGLLKKAQELREKRVPMHYAIIDDMWAEVPGLNEVALDQEMCAAMHRSRLKRFGGDPVRFPNGMKGAIEKLKAAGIPQVGIWFPTTGYWAGIDPDSEEAALHSAELYRVERCTFHGDLPSLAPIPTEETAGRIYDDWCGRVKSWGGDFVKIDNQGFHRIYRNVAPIGQSARALQKAIDAAADRHFDGALINCMGMPSECMFNRTSTISRCSDDFVPESRAWFAKNILQCAYNGLLQGQFYVNDWDMWWTDDDQAEKNALCRAISGGPIYVSDEIGRTDPEKLRPLCLSDGRILRPDESATPTADCIFSDPTASGKVFKVRNRVGENGLLALFNIDAEGRAVSGSISAADVGLSGRDCAYYEHFSGECGILRAGETLPVSLEHHDAYRLYTLLPYRGERILPLGRLDLFVGIGAIEQADAEGVTLAEGGAVGLLLCENGRVRLVKSETACAPHLRVNYAELGFDPVTDRV